MRSPIVTVAVMLLMLTLCAGVSAQSGTDSLKAILRSLPENSIERPQTILLLAKTYAETQPDTALIILRNSIDKWSSDGSLVARANIAFSTAFSFKAVYDSSTYFAYAALEIAENQKDTVVMIDAYNNLGIDHMFMGDDEDAIRYFEQVKNLSELIGDTTRWGHALNNIGMMTGYAGDSKRELVYYEQAASLFRAIGEKEGLANTYLNSGTVFTVLSQFEEADQAYLSALGIFQEIESWTGIQNTLQSRSENFLEWGNLDKAYSIALEALKIAEKYSLNQDIIYTYELLKKIALAEGNYQKAYEFLTQETRNKETVFTQEKNRQIAQLKTQYEIEKKEAEINRLTLASDLKDANLKRSRAAQYAIASGAFIVVLLISTYFVSRNRRLKIEREAQELQVEALKKRFLEIHASPKELAVELDLDHLNDKLHTPLTSREFEALKLSIEGKTNNEIANSLFISINTVKFHLKNSYAKMGVGNRKEAFQFVLKE